MVETDLNAFLFSTPAMTGVFSPASQVRALVRFEWALTRALEAHGLAAPGAGAAVEALLDADWVDEDALTGDAKLSGNIAIPFLRQLTAAVAARSEPAARTLHLGATSQDVLDTALVLQMRDAVALVSADIERLDQALGQLVRRHSHTILSGRTWLQAAPPTTLGLKLAGTLAALRRHRARMHAAAGRALVLQFGGAVGTRAALGDVAEAVAAEVARLLELEPPPPPWHTQRDNLAEMVAVLALLTGSLAKFATDVALLMQTEVGELAEGRADERGGSSTMPHKHNPVACAAMLAIHTTMPGLAATMLAALPQEHERGLGGWQAEWPTVPEAFRRTAAALEYALDLVHGLKVHPERMQANLEAMLGLPMAEAVSMALSPTMGKAQAHALLRAASDQAAREHRPLAEVLKQAPGITAQMSSAAIDRLLDPARYLGSAQTLIQRILEEDDGER